MAVEDPVHVREELSLLYITIQSNVYLTTEKESLTSSVRSDACPVFCNEDNTNSN